MTGQATGARAEVARSGGGGSPRPGRAVLPGRLAATSACAAFILVSAAAALLLDTSRSDLDAFFWPSAEIAAHGHPLLVYSVHEGIYPDANGPLSLVPLSLVAAAANALGVEGTMRVRDALTQGVFAVFVLLMAREAVLAVEAGRGRPVRRLLTGAALLALPPLWVTTIGFGHVEEPLELWLLLLGVRLLGRGSTVRAGICLGLALLSRSVAAMALLTLLLALAADRRWTAAAAVAGTAAVTVAAGLLPFWVADRPGLVRSLITFRGALPISGGSLWYAFRGAAWAGVVRGQDTWIFTGAAVALATLGLALDRRRARPRPIGPPAIPRGERRGIDPPGVFGLLAVTGLCVPMLAKTTWPYYLLDPCVFATIWWLGRPARVWSWRAGPPLTLAVGGGVLGGVEQSLPLASAPTAAAGVAASAVMALAVCAILIDRARPQQPPAAGDAWGAGGGLRGGWRATRRSA